MQRTKPPFRADHVGSLVRTAPLKQVWAKLARVCEVAREVWG